MDDALKVFTGVWIDRTQGALGLGVWTVGNILFLFINLFLGIVFGLVQQPLERLFIHLAALISDAIWSDGPSQTQETEGSNESAPLLNNPSNRSSGVHRKNLLRTWTARVLSVIVIALGVGFSIVASFATRIPSDQVALSDSDICNLYGLPSSADNPVAQEEDALIQGQKEGRAGLYGRGCYGSNAVTGLNQCMLFKNRAVTIDKDEGQRCPFINETYCDGNGFTAVRFTTNKVSAKDIGIKTDKNHKFKREMICVPLNIEEPPRGPGFVEKTSPDTGYWRYDLGPVSSDEYSSDYTFEQHVNPFETYVSSYTLSTYQHVYSQPSESYWQPIPELKIRDDLTKISQPYSLTIMFINSLRLLYQVSSDDPIFPAKRTYLDSDRYYNYDSRARPLACIDWIDTYPNDQDKAVPHYRKTDPQIYKPDLKKNESGTEDPKNSDDGLDDDKSYVFMRLALDKSTAFNAIEFRGATALDAQTKIQDFISLPLSKKPTQWVVEAEGFFETSLARVQYNALDIATGAGHDIDFYENITPLNLANGDLCDMFIFQLPKGYYNTTLWIQLLLLFTLVTIRVMGTELEEKFSENKKYSPYFDGLKLLLIEWLWRKCCCCGSRQRARLSSNRANTDAHETSSDPPANRQNHGTFEASDEARPSNVASSNAAPGQSSSDSTVPIGNTSSNAESLGSNANPPSQPLRQVDESNPSADLADADNYIPGGEAQASNASVHEAVNSSPQAQSTNAGNSGAANGNAALPNP